jgi:hypothetical protein
MIRKLVDYTPVLIMFGGNMSVQMKPHFIRKKSQMRINFTIMNWLQKLVAEINPASWFLWLQSMNYSHLAWPKFKQHRQFGCLRFRDFGLLYRASDFSAVYSDVDHILSSFSLVSTQNFFSGFLVQKWPSWPDFINKFVDACCAWNCDSRKFMAKFSLSLPSRTTFHIWFLQKNMLFNSVSNRIIHTRLTVTSI